jgi:glycosyltransferase involved in cell wall biosynthesis
MYPEKRVDLQVEAFRRMPGERLVVVGGTLAGDHSAEYVRKLMAGTPSNVEYRGRVSEEELVELYGRCKAFICTAVDEDFGMTPVEAMASGKPVVATREGGYLESVVEGETGVFVDANVTDIVRAVREVGGNPERYRRACEKQAVRFDIKVFVENMRGELERI